MNEDNIVYNEEKLCTKFEACSEQNHANHFMPEKEP